MKLLDVKLQCGLWIPAILLAAMLAPGLVAQAPGDNDILNVIRILPPAQQTPGAGGRRGPRRPAPHRCPWMEFAAAL